MAETLPRLRMDLDFMASPVEDRPGLLIRDPYHYSDATLIIPPALVEVLQYFDGQSTELDLRKALVELTGDLAVGELERHLIDSLGNAGFLDNEIYESLREARHSEFAQASVREPSHAGAAYPGATEELRALFSSYLEGEELPAIAGRLCGIAAPHVSPEGGWESYRDAYKALPGDYAERVFVVLGTSHYGAPDRFGLTRKDFRTPYGDARTERSLVDQLAVQVPEAIEMEDYCHANEHSIEFQVAFLQHLYGPRVRILPILCGPYARSLYEGGLPEDTEAIKRFLGVLGELHAKHQHEIAWVLGVDMAHIGRRYGDPFAAECHQGEMLSVSALDKERIEAISQGDAVRFWDQVQDNHDPLKWCGSAPLYTFLKAVPEARARLLRYQQWQIDQQSVVSFAAMAFTS